MKELGTTPTGFRICFSRNRKEPELWDIMYKRTAWIFGNTSSHQAQGMWDRYNQQSAVVLFVGQGTDDVYGAATYHDVVVYNSQNRTMNDDELYSILGMTRKEISEIVETATKQEPFKSS